jgi:hypothetical protein
MFLYVTVSAKSIYSDNNQLEISIDRQIIDPEPAGQLIQALQS